MLTRSPFIPGSRGALEKRGYLVRPGRALTSLKEMTWSDLRPGPITGEVPPGDAAGASTLSAH